jgi:alkylated DNA repair dioxygenase AlkB
MQGSPPVGFSYRPNFVSVTEEAELLASIKALPLEQAQYKEWRAKRRIASFGGRYDYTENELLPAAPMAPFLHPLRERLAAWIGLPDAAFEHALIAEYEPGTQLGWHRDAPTFEAVAGVSLAGWARMRFRPYPPGANRRTVFVLELEPRSAYTMMGAARWDWQHAISPTKDLRFSITFRTLRGHAGAGS